MYSVNEISFRISTEKKKEIRTNSDEKRKKVIFAYEFGIKKCK